jgi:hypothetical protein
VNFFINNKYSYLSKNINDLNNITNEEKDIIISMKNETLNRANKLKLREEEKIRNLINLLIDV